MSTTRTRADLLDAVARDHRGRVLSVIKTKVRDQIEAEDILQEVLADFVAAYDVGQTFEKIGAWLISVAKNKIIDRFRRRKTEEAFAEATQNEISEASMAGNPDVEWTREILRHEIADAVELLPEDQRLVFVMHELEGKSFEEMAQILDVPVNTLLSRKRYAVLFLRNYLKEVYDELE